MDDNIKRWQWESEDVHENEHGDADDNFLMKWHENDKRRSSSSSWLSWFLKKKMMILFERQWSLSALRFDSSLEMIIISLRIQCKNAHDETSSVEIVTCKLIDKGDDES